MVCNHVLWKKVQPKRLHPLNCFMVCNHVLWKKVQPKRLHPLNCFMVCSHVLWKKVQPKRLHPLNCFMVCNHVLWKKVQPKRLHPLNRFMVCNSAPPVALYWCHLQMWSSFWLKLFHLPKWHWFPKRLQGGAFLAPLCFLNVGNFTILERGTFFPKHLHLPVDTMGTFYYW